MDFCNESVNAAAPAGRPAGSVDPFSKKNGISVTGIKDGVGYGELVITPGSLNPMGLVHGGCLAALADTVAGSAVIAVTGHVCVTVNYGMSFLRAALGTGKKIYCRAAPRKVGRTLCVYDVSLTDDSGEEVAGGDFTFFLLEPASGQMLERAELLSGRPQPEN